MFSTVFHKNVIQLKVFRLLSHKNHLIIYHHFNIIIIKFVSTDTLTPTNGDIVMFQTSARVPVDERTVGVVSRFVDWINSFR